MDRSALTPHMQHILVLYLVGHSGDEITARLGIARKTLQNTLLGIKERLGLYSRPELFWWAWQTGLIQEWADGETEKARAA